MASAQISEIGRILYVWTGSEWVPTGSTGGGTSGGTVLYQSASPSNPEVGTIWVDEDGVLEDILETSHIHPDYLNASAASVTYATKSQLQSNYLTIVNASSTYATKTELNNINLTSAINTASAAAYSAANAYTDQEIAAIDLSPYQTISSASSTYLSQSSASSTYATQAQLAIIDVDNTPDIFLMMGG